MTSTPDTELHVIPIDPNHQNLTLKARVTISQVSVNPLGSKTVTHELKSFNSFSKIPTMDSKSSGKDPSPPSLVDNLKKIQDDMINNYDPKIFSEICNIVKAKGEIPFENLNLKNPDHLKLIEQVYNPDTLQSLINKSKAEPPLFAKGFQNSGSSKISSFEDHTSSHKSDPLSYSMKKENHFKQYPNQIQSSPLGTKEMALFGSPRGNHQSKNYNCDDFFNDENVNNVNFIKGEHYGDSFIYSSPMP